MTPVDPAIRDRRSFWRTARPALAVALGLVIATGAIGARTPIVRAAPRLAGLYQAIGLPVNVRGLEIATLAPRRLDEAAVTVAGEIRNVTHHRVAMPRIVYEVRDASGAPVLSWTETAPAQSLGKGRTVSFVSAPHQMPAEGRSLLVRFEDDSGKPSGQPAMHSAVKLAHRVY